MESIWSTVVALFLSVWLLASAVHQLRRRSWERIARWDALNLLPRWSFFAPNPGRHDLHVVYREWLLEEAGPWRQLMPTHANRRWRWCWNPSRYPRKAVSDLANSLQYAERSLEEMPRSVLLSSSYISLLSWVMAQPPSHTNVSH